MADMYIIRCPKCGKKYETMKGPLMLDWTIDSIPDERKEGTPVKCPKCGFAFSLKDKKYKENVEWVGMAD